MSIVKSIVEHSSVSNISVTRDGSRSLFVRNKRLRIRPSRAIIKFGTRPISNPCFPVGSEIRWRTWTNIVFKLAGSPTSL